MHLRFDISACGVLGILRKPNAPRIVGDVVFKAINVVRFRGSKLGAGYAVFNLTPHRYYKIGLYCIDTEEPLELLLNKLKENNIPIVNVRLKNKVGKVLDYLIEVDTNNQFLLEEIISDVNRILWSIGKIGRVYFWSRYLEVFKGVGYPDDIAELYKIYDIEGDLWLAHTRQPTNSPGYYPYWSHPFSYGDIAIVHNGDISSFGSNMEFLYYYSTVKSFVGTDSETVASLFYHLLNREKLSIDEICSILTNPYPEDVHSSKLMKLLYVYRGARLDGPYTLVIGIAINNDLYLIAIADRQKLRPVVIGEDEYYYYVASEEAQIRYISPNAHIWTLKPGSYFIASYRNGIISYGRSDIELKIFFQPTNEIVSKYFTTIPEKDDNVINARDLTYRELNDKILEKILQGHKVIKVYNVHGQRYIGVNLPRYGIRDVRIEIYGIPGNCLANLNHGIEFIVYGNVEDDVGDTMHDGKIIIHGDARDVLGQTFQGGYIFVRGNAGNRVGIQMREYRHKRPYLIVGGRVDNYLGEYMAGGVIMVLGINAFYNNVNIELTGRHVGTGMVGGRIYVRGKLSGSKIGLHPPKEEVIAFIEALIEEGYLPNELLNELSYGDLKVLKEEFKKKGFEYALKLAKSIFEGGHVPKPTYEYRELTEDEVKELKPVLEMYKQYFNLPEIFVDDMLSCKYTYVYRESKR